jgi:hypothetical protein
MLVSRAACRPAAPTPVQRWATEQLPCRASSSSSCGPCLAGLINGYGVDSMDEMFTDEELKSEGPIPKVRKQPVQPVHLPHGQQAPAPSLRQPPCPHPTLQSHAVPMKEHARYKYLLNLDGSSASYRRVGASGT